MPAVYRTPRLNCWTLRFTEHVEAIEAKLGKPMMSSNHVMAWQPIYLGGYSAPVPGFGRLFRVQVSGPGWNLAANIRRLFTLSRATGPRRYCAVTPRSSMTEPARLT